jgi:small subunit ribosomal protein S13
MRFKKTTREKGQTLFSHLLQIYGVGYNRILFVCSKYGYNPYLTKLKKIPYTLLLDLRKDLEKIFLIDKLLKKRLLIYFRIMLKQGTYKSKRFLLGLPANGQSTHANAKTAKRLHLFKVSKVIK